MEIKIGRKWHKSNFTGDGICVSGHGNMSYREFVELARDWWVPANEEREFLRWWLTHNPDYSITTPANYSRAGRSWSKWLSRKGNISLDRYREGLEFLGLQSGLRKSKG